MCHLMYRLAGRIFVAVILVMVIALMASVRVAAGSSAERTFPKLRSFYAMISFLTTATIDQTTCGPPTYPCARRDLHVAQLPDPIPNIGGVCGEGTIVRDPDFGTEMRIRICASRPVPLNIHTVLHHSSPLGEAARMRTSGIPTIHCLR